MLSLSLLLVPLAVTVPQPRLLQSVQRRTAALRPSRRLASLAVIALLTAANAASTVLLVHSLIVGQHAQESAASLLLAIMVAARAPSTSSN